MHYLVTGGAGFIGANYVSRLVSRGDRVVLFDNLSRPGIRANVDWLRARHGAQSFELVVGDVIDGEQVSKAAAGVDVIVHLAGQTAVTTSVADPRGDFESNVLGTLNVLEAARRPARRPIVLYASTNKVYGAMSEVAVREESTRYVYRELPHGIAETQPLDFHSPYGCSKGAGDQYARDYWRIYGVPTVVFRQSCIYGPHQVGLADQGWLAWFLRAALTDRPISICGSGKQVRDVLFVEDLLDAYDAAVARIDSVAGEVFNVGGGPDRTMSIWLEFAPLLERLVGRSVRVTHTEWRTGDQRIYVSDVRKAMRALDWRPTVDVEEGIRRLHDWTVESLGQIGT
jgi:CDP-paratose 2-epimerase